MFYIDEMRLKSEYCRILQKLFIFRDFESIPADLTPFNVLDRLFTVQSMAILSQQEQQSMLKLLSALPRINKILRTREPSLQAEATALLPAHLRSFLLVLFEVGKNRGSYRSRDREFDAKRMYLIRQDRASRVLAWCLRELNLCLHPDFPAAKLTPEKVIEEVSSHCEELIRKNPESEPVFKDWSNQLDRVKFIAFNERRDDQISERLYNQLSPESLILLLFFIRLVHPSVPRMTKRAEERILFRQDIVYIFTNLQILQDPANPPYGLSMRQAIRIMFEGDVSSLDERGRAFLNARKDSLRLYDALLQMDDLPSFVKEFAKLNMADQIFLSALQSIDKFYCEHGRFAPLNDYWYSRVIYNNLSPFYLNAAVQPEVNGKVKEPAVVGRNATEQRKPVLTARHQQIEWARKNSLMIMEQLGLIRDALHPTPTYDITTLCRGLFSEEMISHLSDHDALFLSERTRSVSLYQVLQNITEEQQQNFISSLNAEDAGFLLALRSLDDRFYDLDAEYILDEKGEAVPPIKDYHHQLLSALNLVNPELEATPFAGVDHKSSLEEVVDIESIDSDPELTSQRVWSKATTQGICRLLKLSYVFEGVECTECNSLRTLLNELFTLEQFVKLSKADQLFLLERKLQLPRFIEYVIEHDHKVKMGIYLTLDAKDQGFVTYVSELKYRKKPEH